jgi:thiol:disulfide interchange protein
MQNNLSAKGSRLNRKAAWALIFMIALAAFAMVAIPVWIVQPFKSETPQGLELAYMLKRWSPLVTLIAVAVEVALIVWLWRGARRWWRKTALFMALVLTIFAAWFARQNHFEWMFNPISEVAYSQTSEATFVDANDKVLAVEINGEAAAYPILQMAYHHIVNDVVGGVPIAATY